MGFTCEGDARRVMEVLPKRFEKYGLTIHPEKTRLVPFERPSDRPQPSATPARTPAGTFDLLGFTHYWGRSRRGRWVVKRKTSKSRFRRGLAAMAQWCRMNRHRALADQHQALSQKLRGHFAYYGITGNADALNRFQRRVIGLWRKWLVLQQQLFFTEPKLLSYKELRRHLLGWPEVGRCRPVSRLLVLRRKQCALANNCCCRSNYRIERPPASFHTSRSATPQASNPRLMAMLTWKKATLTRVRSSGRTIACSEARSTATAATPRK